MVGPSQIGLAVIDRVHLDATHYWADILAQIMEPDTLCTADPQIEVYPELVRRF